MPKRFRLEVAVVEAVEQEVNQVRHNGLGSLCLQKLYQMVVGSRQEFYQDLADDADFRFLLVGDRNVVKFPDDLTADLLELARRSDNGWR